MEKSYKLWKISKTSIVNPVNLGLVALLSIAAYVDFRKYIVPDSISAMVLLLGLFSLFTSTDAWVSKLVITTCTFVGLMLINYISTKTLKKDGLGGGDIKLLSALALSTGWGILPIIYFSSLFGIVWFFIGSRSKERIAFAPCILFGYLAHQLVLQQELYQHLGVTNG